MTKRKRRTLRLKWKNLGFIPEGWDDSRIIKYRDEGFLYLCRELRNDWRSLKGYTIKNLKWRPGQGGCNCSQDWTGLDDALQQAGPNLVPPPIRIRLTPRKLSAEEREDLGKTAYHNWVAVQEQQRAAGHPVADAELRPWDELPDADKEMFRRGGESLAPPEAAMCDAVGQMRQKMGEKAFRKKMFELSISAALEKMIPEWTEAERYRAPDIIVKLSGTLSGLFHVRLPCGSQRPCGLTAAGCLYNPRKRQRKSLLFPAAGAWGKKGSAGRP